YAASQADDGARIFGIWQGSVLVGGVGFAEFSAVYGSCEIGCWLEPSAEGHGLITQSCGALLDWAFTSRGLHPGEGHGRDDNVGSSAGAKRLGMTLEGVRREAWPYGDVRHDQQIWAVLAKEWRASDR